MSLISIGDLVVQTAGLPPVESPHRPGLGSVGLVTGLILGGRGVEVLTTGGNKTRWWRKHVEVINEER